MRQANNEKLKTANDERNRNTKSRNTRKITETKLYCRNLIKEINTRDVPLVKIHETILKEDVEERPQIEQENS